MIGPKKEQPHSWKDVLKVINQCPVCGSVYDKQKARLFAQKDQAKMVHFSCDKCQGNFIAMIMPMQQGLSTIGLVSDLDFEDAQKKFSLMPITIDEIINYHLDIQKNNII